MLCPTQIVQLACPILLSAKWMQIAFLLLPAVLAAFGALLGQGSWLRIVTAAVGAASRDLLLRTLVLGGWLIQSNPEYNADTAMLFAFGCASGAALLACLSPYRGKFLLLMAGLGAVVGQYTILLVIGTRLARKDRYRRLS